MYTEKWTISFYEQDHDTEKMTHSSIMQEDHELSRQCDTSRSRPDQ